MKKKEDHLRGYIGEMARELAKMARTEDLEVVAYLLEVAALEADPASRQLQDAPRS